MNSESPIKHVIVGTAGHIDHGKTSLVKALTGVDADTLAEEKSRGITIELGFVFMGTPEPDREILFIDVPGHEKLVKTMVAGASNIDAALFVIAADEGINMQTREHFDILRFLDIPKGIIALTKSDLVDGQLIRARTKEIEGFVENSLLENAPIIPVSSVTQDGVQNIKEALFHVSREIRARKDTRIFRMPIDRVFTMQGFGTVVAGTILSGEIEEGDELEVFPDGIITKVRGIHLHQKKSPKSTIGKRTAVNLLNVEKDKLRRGQCLGVPGTLIPTKRLDVKLHLLTSCREIKNLSRLRFYTGTSETICRVALLDRDRIKPGESAPAQIILEKYVVAMPGDPYVIRTLSPLFTVGGGTIIDINPVKHQRFDENMLEGLKKLEGDIDEQIDQIVYESEMMGIELKDVALTTGRNEQEIYTSIKNLILKGRIVEHQDGNTRQLLHKAFLDALLEKFIGLVNKHLDDHPDRLDAPYNELRSEMLEHTDQKIFRLVLENLIADNKIKRKGTNIALCGHQVQLTDNEKKIAAKIEQILMETGIESPVEGKIRQMVDLERLLFDKIMAALILKEKIVRLSDKVTYHSETIKLIEEIVLNYIKENGEITIAQLRDKLGVSTKYTQAILEYFSETGVTKRGKDYHTLP